MSEQTLIKRATIDFKRSLDKDRVQEVLSVIAEDIKCRLNYTVSEVWDVATTGDYERREIRLSGNLFPNLEYIEQGAGMLPFEFKRKDAKTDFNYTDGIRFFVPPGYNEEEMPEGTLAMMDAVRKSVETYFKLESLCED